MGHLERVADKTGSNWPTSPTSPAAATSATRTSTAPRSARSGMRQQVPHGAPSGEVLEADSSLADAPHRKAHRGTDSGVGWRSDYPVPMKSAPVSESGPSVDPCQQSDPPRHVLQLRVSVNPTRHALKHRLV